jgi:class 3 adenylate cyclase
VKKLEREKKVNLALIHQMLPPWVAEKLQKGKKVQPESFALVTIFFSDVVGFTKISAGVHPGEVVRMLNQLYTVMDYCASLFPLYKVETIGDAYMVVGGLPHPDVDHGQYVANFAVLVQSAISVVKSPLDGKPLQIRIGIHSGAVMAGVVGNLMPRYCLFGDTVNTASRMEGNGEPGMIHCSHDTAMLLMRQGQHKIVRRGVLPIKGKGDMTTYWLNSGSAGNPHCNADTIERVTRMSERLIDDLDNDTQPLYAEMRNISFSASSDSAATTQSDGDNDGILPTPPKCVSILMVEDSVSQRKLLQRQLGAIDANWELSFSDNVTHALDRMKAANYSFDVVLFDIDFQCSDGGLSGRDLLDMMRHTLSLDRCVIICFADDPKKEQAEGIGRLGADDVWGKPPPPGHIIAERIAGMLLERESFAMAISRARGSVATQAPGKRQPRQRSPTP